MYELFPGKTAQEPLTTEDFDSLVEREVAEGVFVEFKRDLTENKKIAKAIAAFANTQGGWLVIGIDEGPGGVAKSRPGIEGKGRDFRALFRNICRDLITPFPEHFVRIATNPEGRSLVAIEVPKSNDTPHLCFDGTIPLRLAASTRNIDASNHQELNRLVERSRRFRERYLEFASDERAGTHGYQYGPLLSLYLWPVEAVGTKFPIEQLMVSGGLRKIRDHLSQHLPIAIWEGVKVMSGGSDITVPEGTSRLPFDSVYSHGGILYFEQGPRGGLYGELHPAGAARLRIPLGVRFFSSSPIESVESKDILDQLEGEGFSGYFDVAPIWHAAAHLISLYLSCLHRPSSFGVRLSMELSGVHGLVAYADCEEWREHARECGVPRFHAEKYAIPRSRTDPFFVAKDEDHLRSISVWISSMLFGVPTEVIFSAWQRYLAATSVHPS